MSTAAAHLLASPDCPTTAAVVPPAPLPSNVAVLQRMIAELRQALAGQQQRVAELEQAMDALLRQRQRPPRAAWPADQPALFPEGPPPEGPPPAAPLAAPPAPAGTPAPGAEPSSAKSNQPTKGHGRRSLDELLPTLPLERREHPRPNGCAPAAAGRAARSARRPASNWSTAPPG